MNKYLISGIAVLILLIGGLAIFNQSAPEMMKDVRSDEISTPRTTEQQDSFPEAEMMESEEGAQESSEMDGPSPAQNAQVEKYVDYTPEKFQQFRDKKRVHFFHAPWCPTCRPADAEFQRRESEIPDGVVLFKTDYDSSTELKRRYNISYQHTFVQVDENGNEVTTWNGGALDELKENVQ